MCAWAFGDSFDCYATTADPSAGYWDSGNSTFFSLGTGRFASSRALYSFNAGLNAGVILVKSSGVNDAVHHISCAISQGLAVSGTNLYVYFQLSDGATNQCCIVFRVDGAVLLTSATPAGTVLATYSGAITASNTWFQFEFEVVISATVGRFRARKNGNTTDDFDSGATLNTRPGANSYANKLTVGNVNTVSPLANSHIVDDLLWRSDAASVPFAGDIRCYTRMPASDAGVQFARSPANTTQQVFSNVATNSAGVGTARYTPFTASYDGTIGTATVSFGTGVTGNMKCSIFASSGTQPTSVLGSANVLVNPAVGINTLTFGTPVTVVKGTQYWIGTDLDTVGAQYTIGSGTPACISTTAYASFPVASPVVTLVQAPVYCTVTIAITTNYGMVNETLQDGTTSYVYDATVNDADFYTLAALTPAPASVVAVTTRAFVQKSDAGTRTGTVQIKSGGTTVAAPTLSLTTGFLWTWRTDSVDPNTGSAWTAAAVSAATIGPRVIS